MRLTARDVRLLRDMALSHVLSRDQVIALEYFSSVTRANTRLRALCALGLVRSLKTPFFAQALYSVTPKAGETVGGRVSCLIAGRSASPRFLQHALCVTNTRLALLERGASAWRFEQQLRRRFEYAGTEHEVRPDGLAINGPLAIAVEADLGHVTPQKYRLKLLAYDAFAASGMAARCWGQERLQVLTVTTGPLRASRLRRLTPEHLRFEHTCLSHDQFGIVWPGGWS